ncbi:unnamed protein product [Lymnaea stagnalis]|uniref:Uncharacterized protein n=1 Tax=Lymnaea stagnalis TaxID=6523 RepID=A0AAV2HC18_LYMST
MEAERPQCDTEYCTPEDAWEQLRMRIKWTEPQTPGSLKIAMLDPLDISLCLECEKPIPLRNFSAYAWTHVYHAADDGPPSLDQQDMRRVSLGEGEQLFFKPLQDNPEGIYRELKLKYVENSREWDDMGITTYLFSAKVFPTHPGEFRLTYNVKYKLPDTTKVMVWANKFQEDCMVTVTLPRAPNSWTQAAEVSQITQNMYLGNSKAMLSAEEKGFDAVLNLDPETEEKVHGDWPPKVLRYFQNIVQEIGSGNEVEPEQIQNLVKWLWNAYPKYKKILIGDSDGVSAVGSAMTAYIFANNPNLTFEEAYNFVWARKFVFCHKGLKETLLESYPRD